MPHDKEQHMEAYDWIFRNVVFPFNLMQIACYACLDSISNHSFKQTETDKISFE